jgi:sugar phosphate isomerase/epimerase
MNRRQFLGSTAATLVTAPLPAAALAQDKLAPTRKSLPIGVFDPPFNKLSLDEMLDRFSTLGIEAVEVGAAGPNGSPHCPRPELVADPAKARAWKKKFDDRGIPVMTLSCHNNALYPDATKAREATEQFRETLQLAGMLGIATVVGFSGCPGGSPTDTVPNWVTYRWPDEHGAALDWQWKERVIPYWRETAKFAREHGVR